MIIHVIVTLIDIDANNYKCCKSASHVTAQHIVTHVTYFDYVFLYQNYWLRSINVCSSAYTSLEQPQIYRIMACCEYLLK